MSATRETAKLVLRRLLVRADLSIGRDPHISRLVRTLRSRGVTSVVDVGANVGQFGSLLRASGFDGPIISLEPLSREFRHLKRRASRCRDWDCRCVAVGESPGVATLHVARNRYSSSLLPMMSSHLLAAPDSEAVGTETVQVTTLDSVMVDSQFEPERTFVKVDTQGYELPVLLGAGDLIGKFPVLQLELSMVPLYAGQTLHTQLIEFLAARGYELFSLEPGIADRSTGQMLQADGVFVRAVEF